MASQLVMSVFSTICFETQDLNWILDLYRLRAIKASSTNEPSLILGIKVKSLLIAEVVPHYFTHAGQLRY